jgi:hypothetical protein
VHLTAAADLDPGHAATRFRLARALDVLGRTDEAREQYAAARDRDTVRWRAPGDFNDAVRSVVAALDDPGVVLADCERHLLTVADGSVPGADLFLEHVHPNVRGNAALAEAIALALADSASGRRLGRWDWSLHDSPAGYAGRNDLDAVDLLLAYRQAAMLWRDVIGQTDPPTSQYQHCLAEVAGLEDGLDDVQTQALALAGSGPADGYYERLQLALAAGHLGHGQHSRAETAVRKALLYGEGQTRRDRYAALLMAHSLVLQELGHEGPAADDAARARQLAPDTAAEAARCSAREWLARLGAPEPPD